MAIAIDSANAHLSPPGLSLALSDSSLLSGIDAWWAKLTPQVQHHIPMLQIKLE